MKRICAIARNESEYLEDWVNYHLVLGFDYITVYDDGNNGSYTNERLERIPFEAKTGCPQTEAYNGFLRTHDFDWCAFIDIDEFITGDLTLLDRVDGYDAVRMFSKLYGDDGKIYRDSDRPVYERIVNEVVQPTVSSKLIVRKRDWRIYNPHCFSGNYTVCDSYVKKIHMCQTKKQYSPEVFGPLYIRHYRTKTLEEFCRQKLGLRRVYVPGEVKTEEYYFRVNERTPEKEAYLDLINKDRYDR